MPLAVIILAAGKGKRMYSDLPKVLHPVGGRPLLAHVLETAGSLDAESCFVVYGHGGDAVKTVLGDRAGVTWVEQAQQLGTGHAVGQALPAIPDDRVVLVLYGDVPLVQRTTLQPLIDSARQGHLGLLTVELSNPTGYGRIVRDAAYRVARIVEDKDATPEQRGIREVNTGILAVAAGRLQRWVDALGNDNSQGEYYLTDVIEMAVRDGIGVEAFSVAEPTEVQGVNDRLQLAALERCYQHRQAQALLLSGVTLLDPARVDVRGTVTAGKDVIIDVDVIFEGEVRLGDRVRIGPYTYIRNAVLGDDTEVLSHCHIEEAELGTGVHVGPYARLRPGAKLADAVRIGNFVEIKQAVIGRDSKVNHLTYIGDAEIGADVNVGAGTITCNYDGANKHKTVIGDRVFVGSNVALVAPVTIGDGATLGAGSTIGKDVPAEALGITRAEQKVIGGWRRPQKKPK